MEVRILVRRRSVLNAANDPYSKMPIGDVIDVYIDRHLTVYKGFLKSSRDNRLSFG